MSGQLDPPRRAREETGPESDRRQVARTQLYPAFQADAASSSGTVHKNGIGRGPVAQHTGGRGAHLHPRERTTGREREGKHELPCRASRCQTAPMCGSRLSLSLAVAPTGRGRCRRSHEKAEEDVHESLSYSKTWSLEFCQLEAVDTPYLILRFFHPPGRQPALDLYCTFLVSPGDSCRPWGI